MALVAPLLVSLEFMRHQCLAGLGLHGPPCSAAFGFVRVLRPPAYRKPLSSSNPAVLVPPARRQYRHSPPSYSATFGLNNSSLRLLPASRPLLPPSCSVAFSLYGIRKATAFDLSACNPRLGRPHGPFAPRCLEAFGRYGPTCSAAFRFRRHCPPGHRCSEIVGL